jgi:hypothetical protein
MKTLEQLLSEFNQKNTLRAPPRNPLLSGQSELAKKVKALANRYETKKLGKIDSPWNRYGAGHSIGDLLFGQSPELLDDMSYGLNPFTSGGKTGRIPIPDERLLDMPVPIPTTGGLGVIKKPGGNWLTGSVENALRPLKKGARGPSNKYPEEILRELNSKYPPEILNGLSPSEQQIVKDSMYELAPQASVNEWIEGPLTKYIKNRMATPKDEVRKLADQGILHFDPGTQNPYTADIIKGKRVSLNLDPNNSSKTEMGKSFEDLADTHVLANPSEKYPGSYDYSLGNGLVGDLGIPHLIDELLNATNPESGLPMNLRMGPEGFKGLTMEEAVKKVHGINQHRALQAEIARKKNAKAEGIPTTKQYDDGFRFVAPEDVTKNPRHKEYVQDAGKRGQWCTQGRACDIYAGGDSRVEILLDNQGNPHAQIAIETDKPMSPLKFYEGVTGNPNLPEYQEYLSNFQPTQRITQIKPIGNSWGNKKVQELMTGDPDYQAKIQEHLQDFVKSGDWSDVSDLDMVGMYKLGDGRIVTKAEYDQLKDSLSWQDREGVDIQMHLGDWEPD